MRNAATQYAIQNWSIFIFSPAKARRTLLHHRVHMVYHQPATAFHRNKLALSTFNSSAQSHRCKLLHSRNKATLSPLPALATVLQRHRIQLQHPSTQHRSHNTLLQRPSIQRQPSNICRHSHRVLTKQRVDGLTKQQQKLLGTNFN